MPKRKRFVDGNGEGGVIAQGAATPPPLFNFVPASEDCQQQISSPPSSSSSPKPLTEANLQLFTGNMAHPNTPNKAQPSTPTSTPSMKSRNTTSTNIKLPIHELLAANNMPMEDREALRRHPGILQWAEEIRSGKRNSAMKTASEQKLMARRQEYERSNEDTFVREFMAALLRDDRERNEDWAKTSWDQDGLKRAWNQLFQKHCIPQILTPDALTKKVLNANPRIKDPKPDLTFGISSRLFSEEQLKTNRAYYQQTAICPGDLWHPFCLVEAKMKGTVEEAEYQCVRGGAALVNTGQQLQYLSGVDAPPAAPDKQTTTFSLAVTPSIVVLHVHWAEIVNGETLFHMHHVHSYALKNKGVGPQLRHDLDNILDWGTLTRKRQVDKILDNIATRVKNDTIRALPTPSTSVAGASVDPNINEHNGNEHNDDEQDGDEYDKHTDGGADKYRSESGTRWTEVAGAENEKDGLRR